MTMLRAGLVYTLFVVLSTLVVIISGAPVVNPSSCSGIGEGDSHKNQAVLLECQITSFTATTTTTVSHDAEGVSAPEILEPRGLFSGIGHAFSSVAHSVTHTVAHAVGHVVSTATHAVQHVAHAVTHPIQTLQHVAHAVTHPIETIRHVVHTVKHAVGHVVHTVKHAVNHVVHAVKHVVHTVKNTVKTVTSGIRDAAHFIKENGPTILKIGTKMLASSQGILATVAKVVPGVGIPLSKGLKLGAQGLDMASNMIHAPVPKGWQTVMNVMNVAEDPLKYGLKKAGLNGAVGAAASMILD